MNDQGEVPAPAEAKGDAPQRCKECMHTTFERRHDGSHICVHCKSIAPQPAEAKTPAPAPVAGDAVTKLLRAWDTPPTNAGPDWIEKNARRECAHQLRTALAQDRASLPDPVPGDQVADIVARWMEKGLSADVAMLVIKRHLDHCYMQPANDYNRGYVAGANSVTERAAELVAAAESASQGATPSAPVGDDRWKALIVQWQRRAEAVGYDGVEDALDAAIAAKSAPVGVEGVGYEKARELLAAAYSDAGCFSVADRLLRTAYVRDAKEVVALRAIEMALAHQPAPSAPVGVIEDAARHLSNWLDLNECECEFSHQCGRTEVEQTRDQLRALLATQQPAGGELPHGFVAVDSAALLAVHSALSRSIGDTDPYVAPDATDEEVHDELPVFWAAQQIAFMLAAAPTPQQPVSDDAAPTPQKGVSDG